MSLNTKSKPEASYMRISSLSTTKQAQNSGVRSTIGFGLVYRMPQLPTESFGPRCLSTNTWFTRNVENTTHPHLAWKRTKNTHKKYFKKQYLQRFRSALHTKDPGRAEYKRLHNGDKATNRCKNGENKTGDTDIDNRNIAPYNPCLLMKYDCHTCVDLVTAMAVKSPTFSSLPTNRQTQHVPLRRAIVNRTK